MRLVKNKKKHMKIKKNIESIISLLILIALLLGGITGYYGSKVTSFLDVITEPERELEEASLEDYRVGGNLEPFAALILGTDIEEGGNSRSDTIIVMTVNPVEESIKMVSIPRDTLITLPSGRIEKMNAAYTTGGSSLSTQMVSDMLNVPIKYYATMDFRGLVEMVDAIDGVTVNSEYDFIEHNYINPKDPIQIKKGIQKLDGPSALAYARMRKQDIRGDFGRQDRQKEMILGILSELMSIKSILNLTNILESIKPYLNTNATPFEMLRIVANYNSTIDNIEQLSLNGEDRREYFPHYGLNVYIWEPTNASLIEVSEELREHLELENRY